MQRATWGDVEDDPDLKSFISLRVKDGEQLLRVIKMTGYIGRERFLPALPIKNEGIYAGTEEIRVCYRNEALNSDTKWIFLTDIEYSRN